MTNLETLYRYRLNQAEQTLQEAQRMLKDGYSGRTITNRCYYSIFYAMLALFLKAQMNLKTSKHTGVIGRSTGNLYALER